MTVNKSFQFLAKFSRLWKSKVALPKKGHLVYHKLHEEYGPIIRDGPNSLSFNDMRAIKTIYGRGKNSFSRILNFPLIGLNPEHPPIFFALDGRTHQVARRKVGGAFTMSSILTTEDQIDHLIRLLEWRLNEEANSGHTFDLTQWVNFFALDVISDLTFGSVFGRLQSGSDSHGIVSGLQGNHVFNVVLNTFAWIGYVIFSKPITKVIKPPEKEGIGMAMKLANSIIDERYRWPSERRDLLNAIINSKDPDGTPIHPDRVRGEVIASLAAGGDTTAMTILGCIGHLLRNPIALSKLREEVDNATSTGAMKAGMPSFTQLSKLPCLDAVIHETLRLLPSIGNEFARIVPGEGAEIMPGVQLPGDVEVSANNWVVGRNVEFYGPDADVFRPERWLEDEKRRRLRYYEFGFGHGARM